ncbi:MAG: malate dehydrogenase [Muribaculaceae bacterium]|nr:malate dehydrogenase [Muribaculaceae bacterium]
MKKAANTPKARALAYHRYPRPGKTEVVPTKPFGTAADLSLAYSPGVAFPCLEIAADADNIYKYTNRGNTVAVVSNGTAVLGLGNIGAKASKPVMEGKAMLFKIFAGIDAFDIEVDATDPQQMVDIVKAITPGFGGINLEDIKAPECFAVEQGLIEACDIPVMHDDQHGTAVIVGAAMLNALKVQNKRIEDIRLVVNGAGAAAIACTKLLLSLGLRRERVVMCDSKGAIRTDRPGLSEQKRAFATDRPGIVTLADALAGADAFLGLSVADVLTPAMLASMAPKPIVFALANPDPEIARDAAMATRTDLVYATGRSDYPNQINNVLGFPYIFRGALDCRASAINEAMKVAAARIIAQMAREPADDRLRELYPGEKLEFGPDYILPKPFDRRLLTAVPPEVARAAADSGVARKPIADYEAYGRRLARYVEDTDSHLRELLSVG